MLPIADFRRALARESHCFADTLAFIETHYRFTPTAFDNGGVSNGIDDNQGSCRVLALALLEGLENHEALRAFGEHYRHVLADPEGHDHANIRALAIHGLDGVRLHGDPLARRD
ncbi:HopJ type III effector protein [Halotalea alkalilenta]|uniref:HopJ type III effector protein n=1 Tax=Halotalea alkalilenta TaxID=376489 RepID=A0A172YF30_9GAMM|nr:HopJ type III effector protein [Halotalea alkalilenta]ANF57881.1 HopJ type III effector protein [Halotalea alkalilenta]